MRQASPNAQWETEKFKSDSSVNVQDAVSFGLEVVILVIKYDTEIIPAASGVDFLFRKRRLFAAVDPICPLVPVIAPQTVMQFARGFGVKMRISQRGHDRGEMLRRQVARIMQRWGRQNEEETWQQQLLLLLRGLARRIRARTGFGLL